MFILFYFIFSAGIITTITPLQVIVTSWLFPATKFSLQRLKDISANIGRDRLVVDVRLESGGGGNASTLNHLSTLGCILLVCSLMRMRLYVFRFNLVVDEKENGG